MASSRFTNVAEAALDEPGVAGVRRNRSQVEPVIRGLGWERVAVQLNHLPVFGACPGRMDPALTYASAASTEKVVVVKGLPSVTFGTAGTGGRVLVDSAFERKPASGPWQGWLRGGFEAQRSGAVAEAGIEGGDHRLDLKASVDALDYGDYTSGGGLKVPAQQKSWGGNLAANLRTGTDSRWWASGGYRDERDTDYPSLPMDLVRSEVITVSTGYRVETGSPDHLGIGVPGHQSNTISPWQLELGYYGIDHRMDNERKPNRAQMAAFTESHSQGGSGLARYDWRLGNSAVLRAGADVSLQQRDALRTRERQSDGMVFHDHIWPDTGQDMAGLFAELEAPLSEAWRLRGGLRGDGVSSRAKATADPALGGGTVQDAWVRFYGEAAADFDRDEAVGAGNVVLSGHLGQVWQLHMGAGLTARAAGITERYFAFAPAPGGYLIGNPTLAPEKKWELSTELDLTSESWTGDLSLYAHFVPDYILTTTVALQDFNNDGNVDRLRGFENVDARLFGFDGSLRWRLSRGWSLPVKLAYVWGENTTQRRALPEIPPGEVGVGLRYDRLGMTTWWASIETRLVAAQNRIDEVFGENATPGFVTFDLKASANLHNGFWLDGGILNLLNRDYHEHLTREALLASGDLRPGDEVPSPGITVYLTARYRFGTAGS